MPVSDGWPAGRPNCWRTARERRGPARRRRKRGERVKVRARGVRRSALAAVVVLFGTVALAGPALAATPEDTAMAAPFGQFADTVRFTVTQISPSVVTED